MYLCICMQIYFYIWHIMTDSDGHRLLAGSNGSILQTLGLPCEMVVFLAGGQLLVFFLGALTVNTAGAVQFN